MVDIVVNHVASLSNSTDSSALIAQPDLLWRDEKEYHELCWIDYGNATSVERW